MGYETALDRWLERCALADVTDKLTQVAETLSQAAQRGWRGEQEEIEQLVERHAYNPQELADLRSLRDRLRRERDEELSVVMSFQPSEDPDATAAATGQELSPEQIRALDAVGPWLIPPSFLEDHEPFGQLVAEAHRSKSHVTLGKTVVGGEGWAEELVQRLSGLEKVCGSLDLERGEEPLPWPSDSRPPPAFETARESYQAWRVAVGRESRTFLRRIGLAGDAADGESLIGKALNELLALFTPARWAYDDLNLSHRMEGRKHSLDFTTGEDGASAALRLNTAELNTFTVTLFLLCALRVDNPLRLLILDDPLQNMDELTVTTLARGLAKVMRLWPEEWQLIMMLNSADDLDRFRREAPAAAYFLPWLGKAAKEGPHPAEKPIEPDLTDRSLRSQIQKLRHLLAPASADPSPFH